MNFYNWCIGIPLELFIPLVFKNKTLFMYWWPYFIMMMYDADFYYDIDNFTRQLPIIN